MLRQAVTSAPRPRLASACFPRLLTVLASCSISNGFGSHVVIPVDPDGRSGLRAADTTIIGMGDLPHCLTATDEVPPVPSREHQIENNHVGLRLAQPLQSLVAGERRQGYVSSIGQIVGDHPLNSRIVLNDQDRCHRGTSRVWLTRGAPIVGKSCFEAIARRL